jgi:hypothetical protein
MVFDLPLMEDVDLSVAVITCAPGVVKIAENAWPETKLESGGI